MNQQTRQGKYSKFTFFFLKDILLARKQTSGIVEHSFTFPYESRYRSGFDRDITWIFVDVGGQQNDWRKWIHHFEDVSAVIFLVAVSEYNQVISLWKSYTAGF